MCVVYLIPPHSHTLTLIYAFTHTHNTYTFTHTHTTYKHKHMHTHTCIHVHTYIVKIYLENSYVFHKHVRSQKGVYAYVCSNIIGKEYFLNHVDREMETLHNCFPNL